MNFISPNIDLKMTADKGRGVFAKESINKGDLILVERPVAIGIGGGIQENVSSFNETKFYNDGAHINLV